MSNFNFLGNFLGKVAKPMKDGHDMSCQKGYSLPFGTINVVDCLRTVPNEHYKCKYGGYVQTAPMREDNFATIYNNMKAVFVPYSSILRNYMSKYGTDNVRKDVQFDYPVKQIFVDVPSLLMYLWIPYFLSECVLRLRGLGAVSVSLQKSQPTVFLDVNGDVLLNHPFISAFAECISASVSLDTVEVISIDRFEDRLLSPFKSDSGNLVCFDGLRLLDFLGYGNYLPILHEVFVKFFEESRFDGLSSELRIVELLPYSDFDIEWGSLGSVFAWSFAIFNRFNNHNSLSVSCDALFAFQYYVYTCEKSNYRKPSTNIVSIDSLLNAFEHGISQYVGVEETSDVITFSLNFRDSFLVHSSGAYISYRRDENSSLGQVLLSLYDSNRPEVNIFGLLGYLLSLPAPLLFPDIYTTMQNSVVRGSIPSMNIDSFTSNPVQNMAEVSALYKFKQDLLRAGVRKDKQMSSLFGVSGDNTLQEDVYILDKSVNIVNIQGLLNQAETDQAPLGARASRGNGSSGLDFTFDSKDFGFIFIVQYFTCEVFYENQCVDPLNRMLISSFWNPNYNNLGLQPVRAREISFNLFEAGFPELNSHDNVVGYSARYYEYKQRVNRLHGLFTNYGLSVTNVDDPNFSKWNKADSLSRGNALFGGFLPSMITQQSELFQYASNLYFTPFMVNNLFVTMNNGMSFGGFDYDQFRCILDCQVHKVSPMPKIGLLRLDV